MADRRKKGGAPAGNTAAVCRRLAEPAAAELGLDIWDVRFLKEGASWILRVVIDKEGGVSIDDCVEMTRLLDPLLDEADPIAQSYCLEVTSPGIERELTRPEHFVRYIGRPVRVRLIRPLEGIREFAGVLAAFADGSLTLRLEDGAERAFPLRETAGVNAVDDAPDADEEVDG